MGHMATLGVDVMIPIGRETRRPTFGEAKVNGKQSQLIHIFSLAEFCKGSTEAEERAARGQWQPPG